jgi:uncharacterized protein (TIGR03083 family)
MSGTGPPAQPPGDFAGLFGAERARLSELLGGLEPGDWRRPSPCPGWTVLGLCCHLLGDDLGLLSRQRDGYHGTPSPEGLGEAGFVAWLDDLQAEWVRAAMTMRCPGGTWPGSGPVHGGYDRAENHRHGTAPRPRGRSL